MKKTAILPNPSIAIEAMTVVVLATSGLAVSVLVSTVKTDNWYLGHINGFIAALMALLSLHRIYLGAATRLARTAWFAVFAIFAILAVVPWFEGALTRLEDLLRIDDLDDLCLWFVLPVALLVAARSERVGGFPLQILIGGFVAQTVSTFLDLMDNRLGLGIGYVTIGEIVDFSEFVFLQLYFIGLTLVTSSLYLRLSPGRRPSGGIASHLGFLGADLRFHCWRLFHPSASHGDYYAARIARRLDRGHGHATLGTNERPRPADSPRGVSEKRLEQWERGAGTFRFLRTYGLTPLQRCVDYGCGSLRVGMHFISFLESGRYWGLDVTSRFFEDGLRLLDDGLQAKAPRLDVISEASLARVRSWEPDRIFSVSVLMHVPPAEVEDFLRKITSLLSPDTRAVILFDCTEQNTRIARMSWTYSESFLCERLRRIDPRFEVSFRFFEPAGYVGRRPISRLGMEIRRCEGRRVAPDFILFDRLAAYPKMDRMDCRIRRGMSLSNLAAGPLPTARSGNSDVLRLAVAQALAGANSSVVYATGAIIGNTLAPDKALATLPISVFVVGMAACTLPAGAIARRRGRRAAFLAGTACGVLTGLVAALAILLGSFWLFCAATFFGGAYAAVVLSFRFAAADCVAPERRPRALSAVMAGGVVAGILGPQLVTYTMDLWQPYVFAATFLAQAAVAGASALVLLGVRIPMPTPAEVAGGRPLAVILRQPRFIIAVICGVVSYTLMNFVMTAAPLAMRLCGLSQASSNWGLQWHIIAMYGPSFFTGRLIARFGASRVVAVGLVLTAASAAIGLTGVDVLHFWLTLILLGLGWNFGFVGASALVLECHRPEERTRVQSLNDFFVFGTMTLGSFASGSLLTSYGWNAVLWVSFFPLAAAAVALFARATSRPLRATG